MNYQSKSYRVLARQFTGEPIHFMDRHEKPVKVYSTMRGPHVRRGDTLTKINVSDWIITKPSFLIVPDEVFKVQFEDIPE